MELAYLLIGQCPTTTYPLCSTKMLNQVDWIEIENLNNGEAKRPVDAKGRLMLSIPGQTP